MSTSLGRLGPHLAKGATESAWDQARGIGATVVDRTDDVAGADYTPPAEIDRGLATE